ncbi:hypothetical protein Tco_0709206, partial [Tanacetum coccineum]
MFVQAHDPDYVPEPIYPEYIPLEDEHEFPAEEQPLPPVDSPTAESPGYVTESDPEEDPEEYEDDETEDGLFLVDYFYDGGDDGDDDDGDSSRDDANDEDEDDEDEEEEHLAPADSTIVVPVDEPVFPPEGTEPRLDGWRDAAMILHHPSTHLSHIYCPLCSPTERLARCTAPPAHSSPPPVPSPLLPSSGCPTQIQTLKIASTQALIDAVTATLPLPPSLYIPPPVDCRDEIPEFEQLPRKRLCLSTLGSRYEVGESSTARPTRGRGIDYGFVSTVDAEERRQGIRDVGYSIRDTWVDPAEAVPEIAPVTLGEVNTRVTELAELYKHDTQDLYALLEDAQDSRSRISQRVDMDSQRVDLLIGDRMTLQETATLSGALDPCDHVLYTRDLILQALQKQLKSCARVLLLNSFRRQAHDGRRIRVIRDMRREGAKACRVVINCERRRGELDSQDQLLGFQVTRDAYGDVTFVTNKTEKVDKYISGLPDNNYGNVKSARSKMLDETIELSNDLIDQKLRTYGERQSDNKRKADDSSRNNHGHQQQPFKRQNVAMVYNMGTGEKKPYGGSLP